MNNDNGEQEPTDLKIQESLLTSENNVVQSDSEPIVKLAVIKKRSFTERWKTSRFLLFRAIYQVLRSIWVVAMVIGGVIAWLIAMLFI